MNIGISLVFIGLGIFFGMVVHWLVVTSGTAYGAGALAVGFIVIGTAMVVGDV